MINTKSSSIRGIYFIGLAATIIGIGVIIFLNIATPLEYIQRQLAVPDYGKAVDLGQRLSGIFNLAFLFLLSCPLLLLLIRKLLMPISEYFHLMRKGQEAEDLLEKARQQLINLPFIMVPINLGLWILLPASLFFVAYVTGRLDFRTATTLALRASMVGFISAGIMSFWIESYSRRRLTPLLFPNGRLTEVKGSARISISRRIRLFYRLGSLLPMAILVVTLMTLQWQLDSVAISARDYGYGILVFSLVLFFVFSVSSSVLNKLISRSIVGPVENILSSLTKIREGDLQTQVKVVSNDEIGILGDATNEMIQGLRERELLRDAFGKYISPEVRDEILSGRIPLDGELIRVTVLFADLRNFTPLAEDNDPKTVVKIINAYFREMASSIQQHSGLVLQFIGDEIEAVFGAPLPLENHPLQAVRAALEMRRRLDFVNDELKKQGHAQLHHGIGIHTGRVVAANIGSPDRLSYALVGDTVNLASRIQGLNRQLGTDILVSETTQAGLGKEIPLKKLPATSVKGKSEPVEIFQVI